MASVQTQAGGGTAKKKRNETGPRTRVIATEYKRTNFVIEKRLKGELIPPTLVKIKSEKGLNRTLVTHQHEGQGK